MDDLFSDHFNAGHEEQIGVEIEYHFLDEETLGLTDKVEPLMKELGKDECIGPCNFLYSDGETLFAQGHERHHPVTHKVSWPLIEVESGVVRVPTRTDRHRCMSEIRFYQS